MSTGRNDPCPCGSGRKFKHCHGRATSPPVSSQATASLFSEAQTLLLQEKYKAAGNVYRKILGINPEHADARHYLGMTLCLSGEMQGGLDHIRASLSISPQDAVFHNNLALWLVEAGDLDDAEMHFRHALECRADYRDARHGLVQLLLKRQRLVEARVQLHELVRTDPMDLESRHQLAKFFCYFGEYRAMREEFREITARWPRNTELRLDFANLLALHGSDDEVLEQCDAVLSLEPDNIEAMKLRVFIEERRGHLDEAERWVRVALTRKPGDGALHRLEARLLARHGDLAGAQAILRALDPDGLPMLDQSRHWHELGAVLDKLGRHDEALAAFRRGKERLGHHLSENTSELPYDRERTRNEFDAIASFFTRESVAETGRGVSPADGPVPLFITGFPRSGTTLLEQMLSMHPNIHAGDELEAMPMVEASAASRLGGTQLYPECLNAVLEPEKADGLRPLRDAYLKQAREAGAIVPEKKFFTDKMTLNETRLGLIHLLFPDSPVIHVIRHPLDVVLSVFMNEFFHRYALTLETIASYYLQVMELAQRTSALLGERYTRVRYEDVVANPEAELRRLLAFLGEPWNPDVLNFHQSQRVARTVSYAQVSQKLYASSIGRWRPYRQQLLPAIEILAPVMDRLGYRFD